MAKTKKNGDDATGSGAPEAKDSKRERLVKELTVMLTDTNAEGFARAIVYALESVYDEPIEEA